jgi:hypothetical protein
MQNSRFAIKAPPYPVRLQQESTDTANGQGELKRRETALSLHARVMGLLWAEMMDCPDAVPTLDRRDCLVGANLSRSRTVGSETAGPKTTAVARLVRALLPDMPSAAEGRRALYARRKRIHGHVASAAVLDNSS